LEDLKEILGRRSAPGLLLFDLNGKLLYFNPEGKEILASFGITPIQLKKEPGPSSTALSHLLIDVISQIGQQKNLKGSKKFLSGLIKEADRPHAWRAFRMGSDKKEGSPPYVVVLIEKIAGKRELDPALVRNRYAVSERELEVCRLICEGLSNKEIAGRLFISEYTVKDHIKHIMAKLGANSRNQIVANLLGHSS
jgi:DNA-binding CsgD family transcriptional regulator